MCVYGPGTLPDCVAGCERPLRVPSSPRPRSWIRLHSTPGVGWDQEADDSRNRVLPSRSARPWTRSGSRWNSESRVVSHTAEHLTAPVSLNWNETAWPVANGTTPWWASGCSAGCGCQRAREPDARGRRPRQRAPARAARQGRQGPRVADRPAAARHPARLSERRPRRGSWPAASRCPTRACSSSTPAKRGRHTRKPLLTRSIHALCRRKLSDARRPADPPPRAAPLLRLAAARARGRPAADPGSARPCADRDHDHLRAPEHGEAARRPHAVPGWGVR